MAFGAAGGGEVGERLVEALAGEVALAEVADLGAGEAVGGAQERGVDLFGDRVAGGLAECPGGGAGGVVPERERGFEVLLVDLGLVVDQRVDQRQADGVRFGAGGEMPDSPASSFLGDEFVWIGPFPRPKE